MDASEDVEERASVMRDVGVTMHGGRNDEKGVMKRLRAKTRKRGNDEWRKMKMTEKRRQ